MQKEINKSLISKTVEKPRNKSNRRGTDLCGYALNKGWALFITMPLVSKMPSTGVTSAT